MPVVATPLMNECLSLGKRPCILKSSYHPSMNVKYIEAAAKVVTNKAQLINIVSKRVRELSAGSRPMVEVDLQMGLSDIALAEIAEGKLSTEISPVVEDGFQAA